MFNFSIVRRAKTAFTILKKLDIVVSCSATAEKFLLLNLFEELLEIPIVFTFDSEAHQEATQELILLSYNRLTVEEAHSIIELYPNFALMALIWNRYSAVNPQLSMYLLGFYATPDKDMAEQMAAAYCFTFLNQTINQVLPFKNKFIVDIIQSDQDNVIKLKVHNKDYGFEFSSPRAMPSIIADISEREIGLN